jgi:hypothetical protein
MIQNSKKMILNIMIIILVVLKLVKSNPTYSFNNVISNNNNNNVIKLPSLEWNSNNKLFKDASNSGINYYLQLDGHIGDSIDLVCPKSTRQDPNLSQYSINNDQSNSQYSVIYRVGSKHEFDNCIVNPNNEETMPILKCDKPTSVNPTKFTIYFVKFSPVPNALEFEEDKEYYFISTSSGSKEGLNYMSGGLCSKYNMRFSIKIKPAQSQQQQQQPQQPSVSYNKSTNSSSILLGKLVSKKEQQDDSNNYVQFDYNDDSVASNDNNKLTKSSKSSSSNKESDDSDDLINGEETSQPQVSKLKVVLSKSSSISYNSYSLLLIIFTFNYFKSLF